jgi:hypothetical protein
VIYVYHWIIARVSDWNAMLTRDLVPTIYMCPLYLKADYMKVFSQG